MKSGMMVGNAVLLSFMILFISACQQEDRDCNGIVQKFFPVADFNRINAGDNLQLTIKKGADFSITAEGCSNEIDELSFIEGAGALLKIEYNTQRSQRAPVNITIILPYLSSTILSGAAKASVEGFGGQHTVMRTILSGASECLVSGTGINANFEISGTSKLTLTGTTESLYGNLSGLSELNGYGLTATEVDISASGSAVAYVFPQAEIFATASGDSRIYYKGNPAKKYFEISGTAKISQQ